MTTANVVDISKYQRASDLDWQALVDNGIKAVIIQLSHGTTYEDQAKEHIAKAKQYGLVIHGYHYYQGTTGEVEFSISNAQTLGLPKNAVMALDFEDTDIGGDWSSQANDFFTAWKSAGWRPALYTGDSLFKSKFNNDTLVANNVLRWVAAYSYEPANYDIWQFSSSGGYGSYTSDIDHDYDKVGALIADYSASTGTSTEPTDREPGDITQGAFVGVGYDTSGRSGGLSYGFSTDGKNFYSAITPYGFIFHQADAERMWEYIKQKINIPDQVDTSSFVTSESMSEYVLSQLKSYALAKNIPDVSSFITKSALDPYALKEDIPSLDGYAKSSDIPKIDLSDYVKNEQLSGYAKTSDMPDLTVYAKTTDLNGYQLKKIADTRTTDQPPSWYFANHPQETFREFKNVATLGITTAMLPPSQSSTWCSLTTETAWTDSSGGYPFQTVKLTGSNRPIVLVRVGISTTAWSAWELMTTW